MMIRLWRMLKGWIVPQFLFCYIFIVSGLIVCSLMLVFTVLWPCNRQLYRKIVACLAYAHWSQLTFLAQWWSGSDILLYMDDEDVRHFGKEHVMVLMNHKYDIDWLMSWVLAERFQMLGGSKIFGKDSLRYLPLIGWEWYFTESIFLKRNWEVDRDTIARYIQRIIDYPDNYWMTVLMCPEGTRFTEAKLVVSNEVCRLKGYPPTKHTLLPRTKGFVLSMHGMKGKVPSIYNITVGFPDTGPKPTFKNIIMGVPFLAHFHCKRISLDDVPIETDEACGDWLRESFRQKDNLYDEFKRNGSFCGHGRTVPRRINDLLVWCVWAVVTCVPLFYYLTVLFLSGSWRQQVFFLMAVVLVSVGVRLMIRVTETRSGSSYGATMTMKGADTTDKNCNSCSALSLERDNS